MIETVAIVGAGFSGTLQAVNLLRHDGPRAILIERAPVAGKGLAYGAAHPGLKLNVRAANMSAFPDEPGHFTRWLASRGEAVDGSGFATRLAYGEYLSELLDRARATAGDRLEVVSGDAVDLIENGAVSVRLADGRAVEADAAVLAVGNLPPHTPGFIGPDALADPRYKGDPWAPDAVAELDPDAPVMVVGTGLTAVDIVLTLVARGFAGPIIALSRRGLLPHRHAPGQPWDKIAERPRQTSSALIGCVRDRAGEVGWRNAVDELRPYTQALWGHASEAERARFLRHLRPWWDIHRHRLAPEVADRLAALIASGQLEVVAGKPEGVAVRPDGLEVSWRPRGTDGRRTLTVQRIINCTGPQGDLLRSSEPLLATLAARGAIRPDPEHLGVDVDATARVLGADGRPNDRLHALGPMTRGAFWEIVAVPDIRRQCWDLARRLAHAQWVGGEGL